MQIVADICVAKLQADQSGNARRLFHGRGHSYPDYEHVVVSWFPPYLHIALYASVDEQALNSLIDALMACGPEIDGVAVQQRQGRSTQTGRAKSKQLCLFSNSVFC